MGNFSARTAEQMKKRSNELSLRQDTKTIYFLLDGMLGSLARWLRIGGYDTEYRKDSDDDLLLEEAKNSKRILLTKDESLSARARKIGVHSIYLHGNSDELNLSQLVSELGLTFNPNESRCPRCNYQLSFVDKDKVVNRVPERTFRAFNEFWLCERCGGIYWRGSHWPKIIETLENASNKHS